MNLNQNDSERDEILHRYFMGELNPDERVEVETWASESLENQGVFNEAEIFTKDLKGLAYYQNQTAVQTEESWDQFKNDHKIKPIQTKATAGFLKYAASVVVVVASAFAVYYYQQAPKNQMIAAAPEVQDIFLSEGSTITLNKNSSLSYQEPFQNNERRVKLEGEAYFNVSADVEKPFVVEAGASEIRVLGTKFYVEESEKTVKVNVEKGKVLVSYQDIHELLEEGEAINLDLQNNQSIPVEEDSFGVDTFWKTQRLVFRLTPLDEVAQIVSEAYGQPVEVLGSSEGCQLTVTFENESLENILAVISGTLNYDLSQDQGTYILSGDGCQ